MYFKRISIALGLMLMIMAGLYYLLPLCFSIPSTMMQPLPAAAISSREGDFLGFIAGLDHYKQEPLPQTEIPPLITSTLLQTEDKRFYQHGGVDFLAICRALCAGLIEGQLRSGASTLTMQLAKMGLGAGERSLSRKLHEMMLARHIEMCYSKEEILRSYLNHADFGQLSRGIETASRLYFNKHAAELDAAEAALLIAQLRSPTLFSPFSHPQRALKARNRILAGMEKTEQCTRPLGLHPPKSVHYPHLLHQAGQVSISSMVQAELNSIIQAEVAQLQNRNVQQAAALVIDNHTGEVLASIASAQRDDPRGGQLDGTATRRSAGSTLKPFVYLLALESGQNPSHIYPDLPTNFADASGIDAPRNYNELYLGPISMRTALASSQNIPAMLALNESGGVKALLDKLQALHYHLEEGNYGLGLAIGNAHVTLQEQAAAFCCLARGGSWIPLRFSTSDEVPKAQQVIAPEHAWQITQMLADPSARMPGFGLAAALRFPFPCAVKTGTSSNFRDNWCVGYSADYTVTVWVGNFDNSPMREVSGITGAAPIFHHIMMYLNEYNQSPLQSRPGGMQRVSIDPRNGKRGEGSTEWLTSAQIPPQASADDYDEQGRAMLPIEYSDWLSGQGEFTQSQYAINKQLTLGRKARILCPVSGIHLILDSHLADEGRLLPLSSTINPQHAHWESPTLRIILKEDSFYAILTEGEHHIKVIDMKNGRSASSFFYVRKAF